jgi:hypothetical protein
MYNRLADNNTGMLLNDGTAPMATGETWVAFFLEGIALAASDAERSVILTNRLIAAARRRLLKAPQAGPARCRLFELLPLVPPLTIERM